MGSLTKPAGGGGGGSSATVLGDWLNVPDDDDIISDSAVSQLRGEASAVPWFDANVTYSGPRALTNYATAIDDKVLVLEPDFTGLNTDAQGIFQASVAGDFCYGARIGLLRNNGQDADSTGTGLEFGLCFVNDAADVTSGAYYACGYKWTTGESGESGDVEVGSNATWGTGWTAIKNQDKAPVAGFVDVFIKRDGNDISFYSGTPGWSLFMYTYAGVGALAGLIGFRWRTISANANNAHRGYVYGFAKLADIPGL